MFATNFIARFGNASLTLLRGCCFFLAALLIVGCGRNSVPTEIRGTVTMDGKPVYPGVVMFKADTGSGLTANLSNKGEFRMFNVKEGNKYAVAVEPIKLAGLSKRASVRKQSEQSEQADGEPPRREATVPDEFKNASIDIPKKYHSFETSGLVIDCTSGIPTAPVELKLD